jgi:hypothetical protein
MSKTPTLYDLYGATSLLNLERSIAEGKTPNAEELAAVLDANSERPLPDWFIALIVMGLRGELKKRRGRPKASAISRDSHCVSERKISALPRMAAETPGFVRARRVVGRAGKRLVGGSAARTRGPNCYGSVAEAHELEIVFEPDVFTIIAPVLL